MNDDLVTAQGLVRKCEAELIVFRTLAASPSASAEIKSRVDDAVLRLAEAQRALAAMDHAPRVGPDVPSETPPYPNTSPLVPVA